jgi:hypothetical protein
MKRFRILLGALAALLAVSAGLTVTWAVVVFRPCAFDAEGGCSYGKMLLGIGAFVTASMSVGCAAIILALTAKAQGTARLLRLLAFMGAVPGVLYGLYCICTIAIIAVSLMR